MYIYIYIYMYMFFFFVGGVACETQAWFMPKLASTYRSQANWRFQVCSFSLWLWFGLHNEMILALPSIDKEPMAIM